MIHKTQIRSDEQPDSTSTNSTKSLGFGRRIRLILTTLAVWGWLPVGLVEWLVHRLGSGGEA